MKPALITFVLLVAACGASGADGGADGSPATPAVTPAVTLESAIDAAVAEGEPAAETGGSAPSPPVSASGTTGVQPDADTAPTTSSQGSGTAPDGSDAGEAGAVGFGDAAVIGCSQTRDAIFGYNEVAADERFGPSAAAQYLGGGSIEAWANPGSRYWRDFEQLAGPHNDALWLMICWHAVRSVDADVAMVESVIERALETIGTEVPVYVSGLNDWDPRSLCTRGDFPASVALADAVVAAGLAQRGPDLGPLQREHTDDGCHGNRAGNELMGHQLVAFFDA